MRARRAVTATTDSEIESHRGFPRQCRSADLAPWGLPVAERSPAADEEQEQAQERELRLRLRAETEMGPADE